VGVPDAELTFAVKVTEPPDKTVCELTDREVVVAEVLATVRETAAEVLAR
jgi:hypothetical protein